MVGIKKIADQSKSAADKVLKVANLYMIKKVDASKKYKKCLR